MNICFILKFSSYQTTGHPSVNLLKFLKYTLNDINTFFLSFLEIFLCFQYFFKASSLISIIFKSHAVGLAVAQPLDFKIDFARNPISGSAA